MSSTTLSLFLCAIALGVSGCAWRPVVDPARGGDVAGAVVGGVFARATGSRATSEAARGGAVLGGAGGAGAGEKNKRGIVRNCLIGRGHAVLN